MYELFQQSRIGAKRPHLADIRADEQDIAVHGRPLRPTVIFTHLE